MGLTWFNQAACLTKESTEYCVKSATGYQTNPVSSVCAQTATILRISLCICTLYIISSTMIFRVFQQAASVIGPSVNLFMHFTRTRNRVFYSNNSPKRQKRPLTPSEDSWPQYSYNGTTWHLFFSHSSPENKGWIKPEPQVPAWAWTLCVQWLELAGVTCGHVNLDIK